MKTCAQYQREYRERKKALGLPYCDPVRRAEYQKAYRLKQKELATLQKEVGQSPTKSPEQKARHAQQQRIYVKRRLAEGIDVNKDNNERRQHADDLDNNTRRLDIPNAEEQAGLDQITQKHLQGLRADKEQAKQELKKAKIDPDKITPLDIQEDIANADPNETF